MSSKSSVSMIHPLGELQIPEKNPLICDTYSGTVHVEWDENSPVTPLGQLVFFVQFLKSCNLFSNWVEECPLEYKSSNAPKKVDVLGTLLLAALAGYKRYSHITNIRNDTVNPPLLGMNKVLSEDSARRAFRNIDEKKCKEWQQKHLKYCYEQLLAEKWILDVDTTVKVLYGKQEGAEVGYNPEKPGRPAHIVHTFMMAETHLILDNEILPGKQNAASYSLPRLLEIIDELPVEKRPTLVRGDCAYGNENVLGNLEARNINYLFKIKHTKKVKDLIKALDNGVNYWANAGQGWEGIETKLKLMGWSKERKIIVLRRLIKKEINESQSNQQLLPMPLPNKNLIGYEHAILVTSLDGEILSLAQLYRDRATCENTFDELKNQWGWAGFVTQDIKRSQIMSRIINQVYNWWSLFVRWIDPEKHSESITSRPLLLYGVARITTHANQTKIKITPMHGKANAIKNKISLIINFLNTIKKYAEQFSPKEIWRRILSAIFIKFLKGRLIGEKDIQEINNKEDFLPIPAS